MRKLKVVLTVLLALTVSLALFACGGGKDKGKGKGQIAGVTIGNQLALTEKDTASTLSTKKATLKVSVTYTDGTTAELTADDWEFTEDSLKNLQTTGEGANATYVIGNYTLDVQPTANNDKHLVGTATAVVDHDWGAADANGVQTCSVEGATKTATKTDVTVEFAGYHDTPIADIVKYADTTLDENAQRIKAFGLTGSGADPHTATVGRLEKGMTISVRGKMIATSDANTYYFPIIGLANRQTDAGFVVRNDGWGIYGGIGGGGVLAKSGLSDHTITAGTPAADTQDWEAYFEGAGSSTTDFLTEQDVELTWRFVEKTDGTTTYNVVELGFFDYTINRSYTVRVKVPTRQFYDTVLHGEMIKMNITDITVIQMLNLEDIVSAKLKTGAKSTYLENEMFDYSTIDLQAKFQQDAAGTTRPFEVFDMYATADETVTADTVWDNLEGRKLVDTYKTYKAVLTVGEVVKEHVFTATELPVQIKKNAVDNANANDVEVGNVTFLANQLDVIPFTQGTGNTAQLTLTGAAASLTAAQKGVLNNTAKNHYAAFTIYQNGPTKFSTTGKPVFVGTEGYAKVNADGTAVDVVVALDKTVIGTTKTVKLTGVNDQDIVIDVSGITAYTYYSAVNTVAPVYLNKAGTVEITYSVATNPALTATANGVFAPKDVRLTIGGSRFALSSAVTGSGATAAWKTEPTAIGRTGVSVVVANEGGKTKITYTIEEDITSPTEYSIQLATNESTGWTVQVADIVYPEFARFAENGADTKGYVTDSWLTYVEGTKLYLALVGPMDDIQTEQMKAAFSLTLNAGADTPAAKQTYEYLQAHDLSIAVQPDGTVALTNSALLNGLATAELVAFGTLNNSKDTDRGMVVLFTIDVTALGYDKTSNYAFKLLDDDTIYTVTAPTGDAKEYAIAPLEGATAGADENLGTATCTVQAIVYSKMTKGEDVVYWDIKGLTPTEEHTFNSDGICTKCQSQRLQVTTTDAKYDVVMIPAATAVPNGDLSDVWWNNGEGGTATGAKTFNGDFAVQYTFKNERDPAWHQDVVIELINNGRYLDLNYAANNPWGANWADGNFGEGTLGSNTMTATKNGTAIAAADFAAEFNQGDAAPAADCWKGDYTLNIYRLGDTYTIIQKIKNAAGVEYVVTNEITIKATDEQEVSAETTVQFVGNPYWVDDIKVSVGTITKTVALPGEWDATATGDKKIWTDRVQLGEVIGNLTYGHTMTIVGAMTGAAGRSVFHTFILEFNDGADIRVDNWWWSFIPEGATTNCFGNSEYGAVNAGVAPAKPNQIAILTATNQDNVWETYNELIVDCDWSIKVSWTKSSIVDVTINLTKGEKFFTAAYKFTIVNMPENGFAMNLTAELCKIDFQSVTLS